MLLSSPNQSFPSMSAPKLKDRRKVALGKVNISKPADAAQPDDSSSKNSALSVALKVSSDGTISLQDYDILEQIGHGTQSTVVRVVKRSTGQAFALKRIRYTDKKETLQCIVNELHCLNILRHANVVRLYTAFYFEGQIHIIMALVNGFSLSEHLRISPQVPEDILGRMVYFVLQGLLYLRRNHFLHRDLKPTNILLSHEGEVKIADFGMARQLSASTEQAKSFLGTICYMAPERLNCRSYSFKSDVWSLGMIVYQCAVGQFPFPGDPNKLEFWELKHFLTDDISVSLPDGYSRDLFSFISECLRVDEAGRAAVEDLAVHPWVSKYAAAEYQDALVAWIRGNEEKRAQEQQSLRSISLLQAGVRAGRC